MSLTLEEVEHIAKLARLELTPAEKDLYREQLSAILEYAARLQAVDTAGVPPTSSVLPPRTRLRADDPQPPLPRADLLRSAPQSQAEQFQVPPVFD